MTDMAHNEMAPSSLDNNNNDVNIERRLKKRFSSVKSFFNDIIRKTSTSQYNIDRAGVIEPKNRWTARKKKKQESMPNLLKIEKYDEPISNPTPHRKLEHTVSVPGSLNLPRSRYMRPVLSTSSLNKADINEDWLLKPQRQQRLFDQSDSSQDEMSTPRERRVSNMFSQTGLKKRPSFLNKNLFGSINEVADTAYYNNNHKNGSPSSGQDTDTNQSFMKRSYSTSNELRPPAVPKNIYREISEGNIDGLSTNATLSGDRVVVNKRYSQSHHNLVQVGSFICSLESSPVIGTSRKFKSNNGERLQPATTNGKTIVSRTNSDTTVLTGKKNDNTDEESITVQIDQEEMFGKPSLTNNKHRRKSTSVVNKRSNHILNGLPAKMSDSRKNEIHKLKLKLNNDVIVTPIEPSVIHSPLSVRTSTSSDMLDDSFTGTFWDDTHIVLTIERIREIAENEAEGVLMDCCYIESEIKAWSRDISGNIRDKIRAYTGRNYKIVVNTFIGGLLPSNHDTVHMAVRGMTEPNDDRFVVCAFEKNDMFVSVTCILIKIR